MNIVTLKRHIREAVKGQPLYATSGSQKDDQISEKIVFDIPQIPGLVDVSSEKQRANGTVMLLDKETSLKYTLHQNGYVRRIAPTSEYTKSVTNGREEQGAPIMKPGGGTPEEMVQCVINNIKLSRKKKFGESFNRAISQPDLTLALREIRSRRIREIV